MANYDFNGNLCLTIYHNLLVFSSIEKYICWKRRIKKYRKIYFIYKKNNVDNIFTKETSKSELNMFGTF